MHYFLFDKSELARDGLKSAAFSQIARVFVNDHREQARSYRAPRLASRHAFSLTTFASKLAPTERRV